MKNTKSNDNHPNPNQLEPDKQLYHITLESLQVPLHVINTDYRILLINRVFLDWNKKLGLPVDVIGKSIFEVFPFLDNDVKQEYEEVFSTGSVKITEEQVQINNKVIYTKTQKIPLIQNEQVTRITTAVWEISDHKEIESSLRESEERFRSLYENIGMGLYRTTSKGEILLANPALVSMLGFSSFEDLKKRKLTTENFAPDYPRKQFLNEMKLKGEVIGLESAWKRKDESTLFIRENARAVKNEAGETIFYEGSVEDVTIKHLAELALEQSKTNLMNIFNLSSDAIIIQDLDNNILDINKSAEQLFGYTRDELISNTKIHLADFDKTDRELFRKYTKDALKGSTQRFEWWGIRKDGSSFPEELILNKLSYNNEDVLLITIRDISERFEFERMLEESEYKYRNLVEQAADGITIIQDGIIRFMNQPLADIYGSEIDKAVGKPFTDFIHTDSLATVKEYYEKRMSGKDVPDEYELALRNLKGEQIFAEIKAAVIDYEGKPADLVFVRDITKRKKAKEKLNLDLETTNKQLHELSSHMEIVREEERTNIAREIHDELGQALTALKMDLAWLTKKFPDVPSSITEKRDSMKNIINDTIQSVKKISTELRPGILDDLGLSAALEWQTEEFNKRSGIACDTRSNPEEIVTDPARSTAIFRIFQECLTNVSRHSKATKVKVRLKDDHGILTLTVSDNGKGISESDIENPTSYGLKGIQERVYPWNGTVKITGSPGKGTVLIAIIPQSN